MRKVWETDCLFHDLLSDHIHGEDSYYTPKGGVGCLPDRKEIIEKSDAAVLKITGLTVGQHEIMNVAAQLARKSV